MSVATLTNHAASDETASIKAERHRVDSVSMAGEHGRPPLAAPLVLRLSEVEVRVEVVTPGSIDIAVDGDRSIAVREALERERDKARAANKFKSVILDNLNHEFRTPLTVILGYTDVLLAELRAQQG